MTTVRTTRGDLAGSHVVLTAGAWSGNVARLLDQRLPMLAARGLSLTVDRPDIGPRRAMLLGEDHVAVGPMGDELRLSAWFQLNNFDTVPTPKHLTRLEAIARRRLRLDASLVVRRRWAGLRPVTPGRSADHRSVDLLAQPHDRRRTRDDRPHARARDRSYRGPARVRRATRHRHRPLLAREILMSNSIALPDGTLSVHVVDSHTGGEPTRVVLDGFPTLRGTTLAERSADLAARYRRLATALVDEPRGNEAMVGALLTEPDDDRCATGVIFFDRTLVLGMCGHGMIGLVETLYQLGRIGHGDHHVETPVGVIAVGLGADNRVSIDNVVSRRINQDVVRRRSRRSGASWVTSPTEATRSSCSPTP